MLWEQLTIDATLTGPKFFCFLRHSVSDWRGSDLSLPDPELTLLPARDHALSKHSSPITSDPGRCWIGNSGPELSERGLRGSTQPVPGAKSAFGKATNVDRRIAFGLVPRHVCANNVRRQYRRAVNVPPQRVPGLENVPVAPLASNVPE